MVVEVKGGGEGGGDRIGERLSWCVNFLSYCWAAVWWGWDEGEERKVREWKSTKRDDRGEKTERTINQNGTRFVLNTYFLLII